MEYRIEEFMRKGKNFVYYDLADFKTNDEFREFTKTAKDSIGKYAECSILTITNIKEVKFDSEAKNIMTDWMEYNKPYVKFGAIIGFDGVKKIVFNALFKLSGRKNITFSSSKEQAIEFLLKQ